MKIKILYFLFVLFLITNFSLILIIIKLKSDLNNLREIHSSEIKTFSFQPPQSLSVKYLEFLDFFITKILKSEKEPDFETKLELEKKIREMQDEEILEIWNKFINSKTEEEVQNNVKDLIHILVKKSLNKK